MKACAASKASTGHPPSSCASNKAKPAAGPGTADGPVDQLDFEFVLFASAVIDYDYIMGSSPSSRPRGRARPR